ncbi:MAG: glycosyltransferase [Nitrososphaerota archaeon]|jgi:cellulose synthase/poly-beta-1,6-N-acetylglucosamine synthase-like glycosyltransferase|nr:glycosyltransferase [Nitrososphaerota archaeon]
MTQNSYPKVSIIVASYNSADTIKECLQSLLALDYPRDHVEVLVMDGLSKDNTVKIAEQLGVKVLSINLSAPAAYNYAQKIVSHPILGFVDSDAKVEPEWLKKLVGHLDETMVAGVSGAIETWNQANPWAKSIGYELKSRYQRIGKYTSRIATMNLLLKKSVIEEAGGWDENLPSQYDTDFGHRIAKRGYKIAYEPSAVCYHYNRPTLKAFYRQQLQYGKNTLRLYLKHGKLAKGDEITDIGMNLQPLLLLSVVVLFCLGFVSSLRLLWIGPPAILMGMLLYFTYLALKISHRFHDWSAMRLVVLYFVRSIAWFNGAVTITIAHLSKRGKKP